MLLEELVADRLTRPAPPHLQLIGPAGSGRATALRHLAWVFGARDDLVLIHHDCQGEELGRASAALVVSIGTDPLPSRESWRFAPWTDDDRIEYLLARHPARCSEVLARCQGRPAWLDLEGHAGLWSACLDELAWDPELRDLATALAHRLERAFDSTSDQATATALARASLEPGSGTGAAASLERGPKLLQAALEIRGAALCLGAILVRRELQLGAPRLDGWARVWRPGAVQAVASVIPPSEDALAKVEGATFQVDALVRSNALGVLHALDPARSARALLSAKRSIHQRKWIGARLPGITLVAAEIVDSTLRRCCLREANLERVTFQSVEASNAEFRGARMQGTSWFTVAAPQSDFAQTEAARAIFIDCTWTDSSWRRAALEHTGWEVVDLSRSQLDAARLVNATLRDCVLVAAQLGSVDLSRAMLERCDLSDCDFRAARLERTVFRNCALQRTEWSHVAAPRVELRSCVLRKADLTGSVLTGGSLHGSSLESAGLADVSWVDCDLSNVDFTHASFHLGSTRSGQLVGAPPSWGTRTGFYPRDDGLDSDARPDRVRKADLRGCDLRGAEVRRCDFYLVDLRGAYLSASQVEHLTRCKAILDRELRVE